MNRETAYVSSIPEQARIKVTAKQAEGKPKRAEYYIGKELVVIRVFHSDGSLETENAYRDGRQHGWDYRWSNPGELLSAIPYENGVEHGTAYQWGSDGRLIGTYTMEYGTGIDLWRQDWEDGTVDLSEVYYKREGLRHGFEWWFFSHDKLSDEKHWQNGELHGIEREWRYERGNLARGYPRYWVQGQRVTKAQYLRAAAKDTTLPPFRLEDNLPHREFPPEIAQHLRRE